MTDTITLPRAVIEQALDALNGAEQMNALRPDKFEIELSADEIDALANILRAALAQQAEQVPQRKAFETWAVKILGDNPTWCESGDCELAWQAWMAAAPKGGV